MTILPCSMDSISQTTGLINLMDEFFIPEKDAKNYIQVIEDYTALRQNVADILRNEYNKLVEPEIREISNLCFITEQYINLSFDSLAIFRANQLYNTTDEPWVVRRNRIYPYSELLRSDSSEDVEMPLRWDFDYLRFIASFYDFLSASDETNKHNPEAAFGKSLNCVLLGGIHILAAIR